MSGKKFEPIRWLVAMLVSIALVGGAAPVAAFANPSSPSDEPSTSQVDVKKDDNKTDKEDKDKKSSDSAPDPKPEPTVDKPKPEPKPEPKPTVDKPIKTDPVADPVKKDDNKTDKEDKDKKSSDSAPDPKPEPKPEPTVDKPKPEPKTYPQPSNPGPKYGPWSDWSKEQPTCENPSVTQTKTRTVTTYKWDGKNWVVDKVTTESKTREVSLSEAELKKCRPEQPAPKVEQQLDLEGYTCEGVWNRERTVTTPYVWDGTEWVLGEPEYGPWGSYFRVRDITFADAVEFGCIDATPPTKADVVKYGDYNGPAPTCENPSVEHSRTIYTTKFTFTAQVVNGEWQWVESSTTTEAKDPVTKTVTLTPEEAEKCKPEQPAPKVEQQLDLEGYTCEGVWNRERTVTTPYVWDGTEWVLGEPEYGPWGSYFRVRDITFADAVEFGCIDATPPTKADVVKYGEYEGAQPTCENPSVEWSRTIYTTKFTFTAKFVNGEWQWVESSTTTEAKDPVTKTVTLTPEELKKCKPTDPPVKPSPKPTPSETAKPKPSTSTPPASTPPSGTDEDDGDGTRNSASALPWVFGILAGLAGLGGGAMLLRRRNAA